MRVRIGGATIDIKLAGARLCAILSVILFICSTIFFVTSMTRPDLPKHRGPRADVERALEPVPGPNRKGETRQDKVLGNTGYGIATGYGDIHAIPLVAPKEPEQRIEMVMEAAKPRYEDILSRQERIIQSQVRPPDAHYNVNITLSDRISLDRSIRDTRPLVCRNRTYDRHALPKASVVIPFYNEGLSTLLRTVHSVLNRSPSELLLEVLLVDDKSTESYLQESLAGYIKLLPRTRLIRNTKRQGLIKSRLIGYRQAVGQVVIFLDAHSEANEGWLEPLLDELQRHPNSVIQPFVDGIDAGTIEYTAPPTLHAGGFSWDLGYRWIKLRDHEAARAEETGYPYFSPTLVGCAIAVYKEYFEHIGEFDEELKVWGGENTELAFRTWMCHGRVVTVICSRVGHIFKNFPYKFDGDKEEIVTKNLMRVAETWMDGFRKYFYASTRVYSFKRTEFNAAELKTLKQRIELRQHLRCHNFDWYIHNIIPQIEIPPMEAVYYGEISNINSKACWEVTPDYYIGMNYVCYEHKIIPFNNFYITQSGLLKYRDKCIRISPSKPVLRLGECPAEGADVLNYGKWSVLNFGEVWGIITVLIRNQTGGIEEHCIMQVTNVYIKSHLHDQMPQLAKCDKNSQFQVWAWTYRFDWSQVPTNIMNADSVDVDRDTHFIV